MEVLKDWTPYRARVAALTRHRGPDDPEVIDARRVLAEKRIRDFVEDQLRKAPPLTADQLADLAQLFTPGADGGGPDAA